MTITSASLLVRLCQKDDQAAWHRMNSIYQPLLRAWLHSHGLPRDDIEDLVQDVLVVVCQRLPEFAHNGRAGAFRGWLKTIVLHRTQEFWRKGRLRRVAQEDGVAGTLLDSIADPRSELNHWWDRQHDCLVARRALALIRTDFSPGVWEIFRLLVLENRSADQVLRQTGAPSLNAVYAAKSRVLARLRQELKNLIDL